MAKPETRAPGAPAEPARILDRAGAEGFVAGLLATMRDLEAALARESEGVRAGRLADAMTGADAKAALAAAYMNGLEAAKANAIALARFAPDGIEALKTAHRRFAGIVEVNQAVLATARSVSEGLVKTLAEEIGRARTPMVYGRPSHAPSPYGRNAGGNAPLVLSRNL